MLNRMVWAFRTPMEEAIIAACEKMHNETGGKSINPTPSR